MAENSRLTRFREKRCCSTAEASTHFFFENELLFSAGWDKGLVRVQFMMVSGRQARACGAGNFLLGQLLVGNHCPQ